ncbi:MAG: aminotransferase class I/II-fold pyridoxal phosphate-dependent enzyme, partial [Thermoleophilaceae bacterium]|nr:aminotransferase class I/II-fold pyridoxal phosphate-dependent enzyme [Thermoleophilaceae bacterium]
YQSRAFMFTAAAVPAAVGAAREALRITRSPEGAELFARVLANARYLSDGLTALGFEVIPATEIDGTAIHTPIVPVMIGDDWRAALMWKALYDAGLYVNVALYPAVRQGAALLRTSVMATHEREHLDRALELFDEARASLPAE